MGRVKFFHAIQEKNLEMGAVGRKERREEQDGGGLVNWQKSRCFTRGHFVSSNLQEKSVKFTNAWS